MTGWRFASIMIPAGAMSTETTRSSARCAVVPGETPGRGGISR